jgi:hypothetical protein
MPMESDKSFAAPLGPGTGLSELEQAGTRDPQPGTERRTSATLEPEGVELAATPGSRSSPLNTLKLTVLLAVAGWLTFLYFSNDNIPVSDYRLSTMLPRPIEGWKGGLLHSGNPSSVSIDVGLKFEKFTSARASRTYSQGDKEITIEIWDWAGDYPYHMPIDIPGWANGEPVRAGAEQGRLRYRAETKKGRLRVRYMDRFYLIVEGQGIERYELENWYRRIDLAGLRRELDQLRRNSASR